MASRSEENCKKCPSRTRCEIAWDGNPEPSAEQQAAVRKRVELALGLVLEQYAIEDELAFLETRGHELSRQELHDRMLALVNRMNDFKTKTDKVGGEAESKSEVPFFNFPQSNPQIPQ